MCISQKGTYFINAKKQSLYYTQRNRASFCSLFLSTSTFWFKFSKIAQPNTKIPTQKISNFLLRNKKREAKPTAQKLNSLTLPVNFRSDPRKCSGFGVSPKSKNLYNSASVTKKFKETTVQKQSKMSSIVYVFVSVQKKLKIELSICTK